MIARRFGADVRCPSAVENERWAPPVARSDER